MKRQSVIFLILVFFLCFSCQESSNKKGLAVNILEEIVSPCKEGGEPNLFVSENGQVYLSWVEYMNDTTDALLFSKLENGKWSSPNTIASGTDWFVNWADFPSIVAYEDDGNSLAAHWLQKSDQGTYNYDVRISQSLDGGKTWNPTFIPHRDSISAEHGFVSMLPISSNKVFATWLDGRNAKGEGHDAGVHEHHGAMSLRTAIFDKNGNLTEEAELDNRICDCCQTTAAITDEGIIVAYRDRSEDEIRDISIVRKVDGKWTLPKSISNDNWLILGCPVNGPAIAAYGKNVALAWFTMSDENPKVKVAFSKDNGANFSAPIQIDDGNPIGRVDVVMITKEEALVTWLEKNENDAEIKMICVNKDRKEGESITIAHSKSSRQSGFPRMVKTGSQIIFAWTHIDSLTTIKTGILTLK